MRALMRALLLSTCCSALQTLSLQTLLRLLNGLHFAYQGPRQHSLSGRCQLSGTSHWAACWPLLCEFGARHSALLQLAGAQQQQPALGDGLLPTAPERSTAADRALAACHCWQPGQRY